jgi:hypothetical protein
MCTGVHEYLAVAWMNIALSHREELMELQLPSDAAATARLLSVRSCLLRCYLPAVNLLEASFAGKKPPPRGADEWALEPAALELAKPLAQLCHAGCVNLSKEWPTEPHVH